MPVCTPNQRTGPDQAAETPDRQLQRVRGQTTSNNAEAEGVPGCTVTRALALLDGKENLPET